MQNFTPVSALIGGGLIGLAAILLMLVSGRVAGVSGIVGGLLDRRAGDAGWRLAFIAGLVGGAFLAGPLGGFTPPIRIDAGAGTLIAAGLLVGFGTRLGSGCTSGHGVCGLARLSPRSLVATGLFIATGAAIVFIARHLLGA